MRRACHRAMWNSAGFALAMGFGSTFAAMAQTPRPIVPPGWHVHHVRIVGRHASALDDVTPRRSLTVRKPFAPPPTDDDGYTESGTVYNNVAAFVPEPKIDSGVQFPYGLDGVGGYGSDIGFSAGNDTNVYDRGALDHSRTVRAVAE